MRLAHRSQDGGSIKAKGGLLLLRVWKTSIIVITIVVVHPNSATNHQTTYNQPSTIHNPQSTRNHRTRSRPQHLNITPPDTHSHHKFRTAQKNTATVTMRGYFGIMRSSDSSAVELHGNGEKVLLENKHCLWTPRLTDESKEPLWHLRVQVLKDHEGRGDAPGRIFVRPSPTFRLVCRFMQY